MLVLITQKSANICPSCGKGSLIVDTVTDEIFCHNCGYVIGYRVEEWKQSLPESFDFKKSTTLSKFDIGSSTTIGKKDIYGQIPFETDLNRLRVLDVRSTAQGYIKQSLKRALIVIKGISDKLAISDAAIDRAAQIYYKAVINGLIKGRASLPFIIAAIYIACREMGIARSLREVAKAGNANIKESSRSYRILMNKMGLKIPSIDPAKWISVIANKVGLSEKTGRSALKILREGANKLELTGKLPIGIAAAALYMAALKEGESVMQKDIARAAGVTTVTIRNRYKDLQRLLGVN